MQGLLSRLQAWIGLSKPCRVSNESNCHRSESMSALPQAHKMEQVFENLAARKTAATSQSLELQPPWRVVLRDGSTSSVAKHPSAYKQDCPDCLAGRCGQNPQGCQCSSGGGPVTISLNRLAEPGSPSRLAAPAGGTSVTAAMPQAKPQLFEQPAKQPPSGFLEPRAAQREPFLIHTPRSNAEPERCRSSSPAVPSNTSRQPATTPSAPQILGDELQTVINHWPWLTRSTRRAILALVQASTEADRA